MKRTTRLRKLLESPELLVVPRVHDALGARVAEVCGFQAVQVSGFGVAAALLGKPDVGLLTMSEMVMMTRYIAQAVDIPVMTDGDTGYGNALNVYRTVQEFEAAGAAGVNLEDQVFPKKCGHMDGKFVISQEEMVKKIQAAVDARKDPDFIICARTDAIAVYGIEEAIRRGNAYADAGADLIFMEAPESIEQVERVIREVKAPVTVNLAMGGKTPHLSLETLQRLGAARVSVGGTYFIAAQAFKQAHEILKRTGTLDEHPELFMPRSEFYELVHMPFIRSLEHRYLTEEELSSRYGKP